MIWPFYFRFHPHLRKFQNPCLPQTGQKTWEKITAFTCWIFTISSRLTQFLWTNTMIAASNPLLRSSSGWMRHCLLKGQDGPKAREDVRLSNECTQHRVLWRTVSPASLLEPQKGALRHRMQQNTHHAHWNRLHIALEPVLRVMNVKRGKKECSGNWPRKWRN